MTTLHLVCKSDEITNPLGSLQEIQFRIYIYRERERVRESERERALYLVADKTGNYVD